jgi:hypothetical protein
VISTAGPEQFLAFQISENTHSTEPATEICAYVTPAEVRDSPHYEDGFYKDSLGHVDDDGIVTSFIPAELGYTGPPDQDPGLLAAWEEFRFRKAEREKRLAARRLV